MEKPIGKAIILCDQVIDDFTTRKKTLVGIFTKIYAGAFPAQHPTLTVYVAITNGTGIYQIKLALKSEGDDKEIFAAESTITLNNPNQVSEFVFNLLGLTFESPGQYSFEIYANSEFIFESKFDVEQQTQQPIIQR